MTAFSHQPLARNGSLYDLSIVGRFACTICFAVDAMSPRFLRDLSEALVEFGLHLQWSAELRLE